MGAERGEPPSPERPSGTSGDSVRNRGAEAREQDRSRFEESERALEERVDALGVALESMLHERVATVAEAAVSERLAGAAMELGDAAEARIEAHMSKIRAAIDPAADERQRTLESRIRTAIGTAVADLKATAGARTSPSATRGPPRGRAPSGRRRARRARRAVHRPCAPRPSRRRSSSDAERRAAGRGPGCRRPRPCSRTRSRSDWATSSPACGRPTGDAGRAGPGRDRGRTGQASSRRPRRKLQAQRQGLAEEAGRVSRRELAGPARRRSRRLVGRPTIGWPTPRFASRLVWPRP